MKLAAHARTEGKISGHLLAAGFVVLSGLIYAAVLLPHQLRNREQERKLQRISADLEAARAIVQRVRDLETLTSEARATLNNRLGALAGRPFEEWLPQVIRSYFQRVQPLEINLRPGAVWKEDGLPGYQRNEWTLEVAVARDGAGVDELMKAVSELTLAGPFIKVTDFTVQPDPQNAAQLKGALTLVILDRIPAR